MFCKFCKSENDAFRLKLVEIGVALSGMVVLMSAVNGQATDATQIMLDSTRSQLATGAKVQCSDLLEIMNKTDASDRFTVSHNDTLSSPEADSGASPSDFSIKGNVISLIGGEHVDAVTLDVFDANGVSVYRSQETMQARKNARIVYPGQFSGLYYVKLQTGENNVVFKCLGAETCALIKFSSGAGRASRPSQLTGVHSRCEIKRIGAADDVADAEKHYCECPSP